MKTPTQKKEKQIITSMKDGEQSIQRISLQKTVFGDRLFANFSKEDQMVALLQVWCYPEHACRV